MIELSTVSVDDPILHHLHQGFGIGCLTKDMSVLVDKPVRNIVDDKWFT
jgi:hypothetical protein